MLMCFVTTNISIFFVFIALSLRQLTLTLPGRGSYNGKDIFAQAAEDSQGAIEVDGSCIKYRWLGNDYWVDYGDCCLNVAPTQKHFYNVGGEWPNYLMPIPANEITKAGGTIVQNPGY